jgi:hypothetical protein
VGIKSLQLGKAISSVILVLCQTYLFGLAFEYAFALPLLMNYSGKPKSKACLDTSAKSEISSLPENL